MLRFIPALVFAFTWLAALAQAGQRHAVGTEATLLERAQNKPNDFEVNHLLGEFYIHKRNLEKGILYLRQAWKIDPSNYTNGYDLAVAYRESGHPNESHSVINDLLQRGDNAELHNLLGDLEESERHVDEAARQYETAARMDPSEKNLFDLGSHLLSHQSFQPALKVFEFATRRYPGSARLFVGLGIADYSVGQYNEAVQALCRGLDLDPADTKALDFLGRMHDVSAELADNINTHLAHFVALYPQNAQANYYYAVSLRNRQTPDAPSQATNEQAKALLKKSIALKPTFAEAHYELGLLYEDESRVPSAIAEYQAALKCNPRLEKAHFHLGRLYQKQGESELAQQEFQQSQALKANR
jgi:tetratricopeptide (TPR) repeat protein